jgi:AAA+ superfamily predicted ATPase
MNAPAATLPEKASAAELAVERLRLLIARHEGEEIDGEALGQVEDRLAGEEGAYRARMAALFALSDAERDALDCAVAIAAEPALGMMIAQVQGMPDRHLPTEIGLRLLFGHGPAPVVRGGSPLVAWGLVETVMFSADEPIFFRADPAAVDWYFGTLSASAIPLRRVRAVDALPEWQVKAHARRIAAILAEQRPVRVAIVGRRGTGRASFADCLARALGKQAVCVEPDILADDTRHSLFLRLQRLALLGDLALIWRGAPASWPASLPVSMLQMVTLEPGATLAPVDGLIDLTIAMPPLGAKTRAGLYRAYLPGLAKDMDAALGEPRIGDLADAAAQKIATLDDLRDFLRQRNSARTAQIGRVERADFGWDDLILNDRTKARLMAFADEARRRAALLTDPERRRVYGDSAHLSALFSGPPGLGKSMSAKVIASVLGLDLLVVDSAAITSKFIGETAKNLTLAFEIARDAQCALHFEEADNFFTTRVKVETSNDRHSNADIGHLLQLMEHHEGVVILSSNRRVNIDAAFTRRLRFIVEYRKPEYAERVRLWDRMLALLGMKQEPRDALVPQIAAAHELTPAQIKGAALTAAYRASKAGIAAADVEEGVRIEFQKEGRLVSAVTEVPPPQRPGVAHG